MKIIREINGKSVEFELTELEQYKAYEEEKFRLFNDATKEMLMVGASSHPIYNKILKNDALVEKITSEVLAKLRVYDDPIEQEYRQIEINKAVQQLKSQQASGCR